MRLTLKQEAFCLAYTGVCAGNATAAYKMAGYHVSSDNVAGVNGNNCLKKPAIQARIRAIQQEAAKNSKVMMPQQMQEVSFTQAVPVVIQDDIKEGVP